MQQRHAKITRAATQTSVLAALLLSCASSAEKPPSEEPAAREAATIAAAKRVADAADAMPAMPAMPAPPTAAEASAPLGPIPRSAKQLIVTVSKDWSGADAVLHRFERGDEGPWLPVGAPFDTVLGRTGLGWGRGLHQVPDSHLGPVKVEGDGKSPAGVFAVGALYGYDETFDGATKLGYQQVDKTWRCVNDSSSQYYNRVLTNKGVEVDWKESEDMRRRDELYRLVVAIDHNSIFTGEPVAEGGSCIFFHVWRRAGAPTIGCTAMPLARMKLLASWLDPAEGPVLVALPRNEYRALQESWRLPPL